MIKSLEEQYTKASEDYLEATIIPPFFCDLSGHVTIHGVIITSLKYMEQENLFFIKLPPGSVKKTI